MPAPVLFDLDGVLVDSRTAIARSMNHALERVGVEPWPETRLHPLIGPPLHDAFAEVLEEAASSPRVDACVTHYRERYRTACLEETLAVEGIAPILETLARERTLVVATSKPTAFAEPILHSLGMATPFLAIVGPSLDARSEPKRVTVGRALDALAADEAGPARMVGDRSHDVVAGRAHGLVTVGVTWGIGSRDELTCAGVDLLIERPAELLEVLDQHPASAAGGTPRADPSDSARRGGKSPNG